MHIIILRYIFAENLIKDMKNNTYIYRFENEEQRKAFKIAVTEDNSSMQETMTVALNKKYPNLFKSLKELKQIGKSKFNRHE